MSVEALSSIEDQLTDWTHQLTEGQNPFAQVTEEKIQEMYQLAFLLYQRKQYQEASYFFRLLTVSRPDEAKYWKGFGACLKMLQDYEPALNCYKKAQFLSQGQPDPYVAVYTADCYFALKQIKAGLKALDTARLSAEKNNDKRVLKHVTLMRELWSKSI